MSDITIDYTWKIMEFGIIPYSGSLKDIVARVDFQYIGTSSDGHSAFFHGSKTFGVPEPHGFIEFSELDHDTIASWLESSCHIENMRKVVIKQLDAMREPTITRQKPTFYKPAEPQ